VGLLAELFSNVLWFHNPLPVALLIYSGNALEAVTGEWLVNRTCRRPVRLDTDATPEPRGSRRRPRESRRR
jgi:integral membrane sensor domain MASE1